jgi:hypothetical protein
MTKMEIGTHKTLLHGTSHHHTEAPAHSLPETTDTSSLALIEALNNLGQKLDIFTGIFATMGQIPSGLSVPQGPAPTIARTDTDTAQSVGSGPKFPLPDLAPPAPPTQQTASLPEAGARIPGLMENLGQARGAWSDQTSAMQHSVEAIMSFLENQAAIEPPKFDATDILNRLSVLEEQQRNLQSQVNTSR